MLCFDRLFIQFTCLFVNRVHKWSEDCTVSAFVSLHKKETPTVPHYRTIYPYYLHTSSTAEFVTLDGFEGGFRIGGCLRTNLRYADNIVLIASTDRELGLLN